MLILLRDTDLDGQPIIGSGLLVAGENALEVVQKMQATSPFNAGDVTDYMQRVLEAAGDEAALPEGEAEATARVFLERLAGRGLVTVVKESHPGEDPPEVAPSDIAPEVDAPPARLHEALVTIRDTGLTNMFDHPEVARLARKFGFAEVADWIAAHPGDYVRLLLSGGTRSLRDNIIDKGEGRCADKLDS